MPDAKIEIVYYPKNESFTVRMNIQVVKRGTIRSEANADDILTAINNATSKITDQLRRIKTQYEK
jgi:ribosomal subunit interface protein